MFTAIGPRQEQHVINHACQTMKILKVRSKHIAQIGETAFSAQRELGLADQGSKGGSQLMSDIGIESLQLLIGVVQSNEERVELCNQGLKLLRLCGPVQGFSDALRTEARRLPCEIVYRQECSPYQPGTDSRDKDGPGQGTKKQCPRQVHQQAPVGAAVERQFGTEHGCTRPRQRDVELKTPKVGLSA